ncbi:MAG: glutamine synthetase, partial [Actinobacteria bacterium]
MGLTAEADYVLHTIEDRGIRFVRLWFTDVLGFLKAFTITSQELEAALSEGMGFDGSSIDGFSRIEESDMVAVPDPSTFQLIPWRTEAQVARMFCDVLGPDGTPFEGDPRYVLKRQLKRAADLGFTFYVGPELEYFYFRSLDDPKFLDQGSYFDETPLDVATDWRKRTVAYLESMGIPVEYVHHEVAPSQHEIDLRYADALTMADNVMTYRLTVKEVAQEFGIYATFMPKPVKGVNGSGMHTHQSLFEGDRNAFFDATDEYHLSTVAKQYIAGILKHAPEITLATNQWVNSYKRLVPGYEAPVYVCWARRNRSALVRVPLYKPGKGESTRIEYR